jgi:hypothetical protein
MQARRGVGYLRRAGLDDAFRALHPPARVAAAILLSWHSTPSVVAALKGVPPLSPSKPCSMIIRAASRISSDRSSWTSVLASISAFNRSRVYSDPSILSIGGPLRQRPAPTRPREIRQSGEGGPQPLFQQFQDVIFSATHWDALTGTGSSGMVLRSLAAPRPQKRNLCCDCPHRSRRSDLPRSRNPSGSNARKGPNRLACQVPPTSAAAPRIGLNVVLWSEGSLRHGLAS